MLSRTKMNKPLSNLLILPVQAVAAVVSSHPGLATVASPAPETLPDAPPQEPETEPRPAPSPPPQREPDPDPFDPDWPDGRPEPQPKA